MGEVFERVLDMSLVGCYSILIVMAVRFILIKCERKYVYYLWFAVFLNLCIPLSFRGMFSLIPDALADFSVRNAVEDALEPEGQGMGENAGIPGVAANLQGVTPGVGTMAGIPENIAGFPEAAEDSEGDRVVHLAASLWLFGMIIVCFWNLTGILRLKKRISREHWVSIIPRSGIVEVEGLDTPFLWGLRNPMIYLPVGMEQEERRYVTAHEMYHRKRKDYLAKLAVFLVVTIHWFNPLVWAAYALFCRDMEISCDEAVLLQFHGNIKKQYAGSLLKYAATQNGFILSPLTFGEPAVKSRIKNVLRFKKRGILISILAGICVAGVAAGLLLRPSGEEPEENNTVGSTPQIQESQESGGGNDQESPAAGSDQDPSQAPESGTEQTEANEPEAIDYYGSYQVTDYVTLGIGALSSDEMLGWMGCLLEYDQDRVSFEDAILENPQYIETIVSREEFETSFRGSGGGYTFEALGIQGDSLLYVEIGDSYAFGSSFYVCDKNSILILLDGVFFKAERGERPSIVLTDDGKEFLRAMCYYLPEFAGYASMDEDFWRDFLFFSYTSTGLDEDGVPVPIYGEAEYVTVYREDLGFDEGEIKISETWVREYVQLVFGIEMPEFYPAFENMEPGRTALYYQDGYYYIGVSDFGEVDYQYKDMEVYQERWEAYAWVSYDVLYINDDWEWESEGTVSFHLYSADNSNGFIILGKYSEDVG